MKVERDFKKERRELLRGICTRFKKNYRKHLKLLEEMERRGFVSGKQPRSVVGAVLKINNRGIKSADIADFLGVNTITIKNNFKKWEDLEDVKARK